MNKFSENITESLAGVNGFNIFLNIIDSFDFHFHKINYLNIGDYFYFFYTDKIEKKHELLDMLEFKKSLPSAYETLKTIINERISFYISIKEILEFGFFNIDKDTFHKIGEFPVTSKTIRNLNHKTLKLILYNLSKVNIKNMKFLHSLKNDFNSLFKDCQGVIKIMDEYRIKNTFESNIFDGNDLDDDKLTNHINHWGMKYPWYNKVTCYAVVDLIEKKVNFFIRIKEFKTFNTIKNSFD